MAKRFDIYRCMICGNIVEVLDGGDGELTCCGEPMKLLAASDADAATEKHVPVIEKVAGGYKVKVGTVAHPMEEKHYIEWIALFADGKVYREFLRAGMSPEAVFNIDAEEVSALEFCNVHGLWKG